MELPWFRYIKEKLEHMFYCQGKTFFFFFLLIDVVIASNRLQYYQTAFFFLSFFPFKWPNGIKDDKIIFPVHSSALMLFVPFHRVRSWAPPVPAAVLCSGQCLWSPQEEWLKPPPSISCSLMVGWPNLLAACLAWRTSPTRPPVCLELPRHDGHVECPEFVHPLFWKQ